MKRLGILCLVLVLTLTLTAFIPPVAQHGAESEPVYIDQVEILSGTDHSGSIVVDGLNRTYHYYVPSSYDGTEPMPLVFSFHGLTQNGPNQRFLSGFNSIAEQEGFIIVYPDGQSLLGIFDPLNMRYWDCGTDVEVNFVSAMIDKFNEDFNIDLRRVYANGMSNGGMLSYHLALWLSDRIAAVASVAGPFAADWLDEAPQPRPITVMMIYGTADPVVSFYGAPIPPTPIFGDDSFEHLSMYSIVDYWRDVNWITENPEKTYIPPNIQREIHSGGVHNTQVILYKIHGGGHTWSFRGIHTSQLIWDHLKEHMLPVDVPVEIRPDSDHNDIKTTSAKKKAMLGLLALIPIAVAVWAIRRRGKRPEYT